MSACDPAILSSVTAALNTAVSSMPGNAYNMHPNGAPALTHSTCWVTVTGVPSEANEASLRVIFAAVANVDAVEFGNPAGSGYAYLKFATPHLARSALRLDGYVALGSTLRVTMGRDFVPSSIPASISNQPNSSAAIMASSARRGPPLSSAANRLNEQQGPTHKNLYVLNLPLDATTDQLAALFGAHGKVLHCVILAMLDAQARRRGFIDMSTPQEAKEAIESLNGFVWHGYPIEVSYAIVQRSGGPLSGPSVIRRTVPRSRWNCGPRRQPIQDSTTTPPSLAEVDGPVGAASRRALEHGAAGVNTMPDDSGICVDPFTIFLTGLDPAAILDDEDFATSLRSFGNVVACSLSRDSNGISLGYGVATFSTPAEAAAARQALDGKIQNGNRLSCKHLHFTRVPPVQSLPMLGLSNLDQPAAPANGWTGTLGPPSAPLPSNHSLTPQWPSNSALSYYNSGANPPSPVPAMYRSFSDTSQARGVSEFTGFPRGPPSLNEALPATQMGQLPPKLPSPASLMLSEPPIGAGVWGTQSHATWAPSHSKHSPHRGAGGFGPIGSSPTRRTPPSPPSSSSSSGMSPEQSFSRDVSM